MPCVMRHAHMPPSYKHHPDFGQVVILNGAPRSGKSSIVAAIQATFDGVWMNLGVDVFARHVTPARFQPGVGLRPGSERPDLEPFVVASYAAMYDSIAAHSRAGLNVVADVGHHDSYSVRLSTLSEGVKRLAGLPVLLVGVRCPVEAVMERRRGSPEGHYLTASPEEPIPEPVLRWQREVHNPGVYDLEVDTSQLSPEECAAEVWRCLGATPRPTAYERLLARADAEDPN
jgi:chloramphenicol 3-O phosphotransferase